MKALETILYRFFLRDFVVSDCCWESMTRMLLRALAGALSALTTDTYCTVCLHEKKSEYQWPKTLLKPLKEKQFLASILQIFYSFNAVENSVIAH